MSRLIIDNQSNLTDQNALFYAMEVVKEGRISDNGTSYCCVTSFKNGPCVIALRNKASDRLIIQNNRETP